MIIREVSNPEGLQSWSTVTSAWTFKTCFFPDLSFYNDKIEGKITSQNCWTVTAYLSQNKVSGHPPFRPEYLRKWIWYEMLGIIANKSNMVTWVNILEHPEFWGTAGAFWAVSALNKTVLLKISLPTDRRNALAVGTSPCRFLVICCGSGRKRKASWEAIFVPWGSGNMKPRVNGDTRNKKGQIPGNLWRRKGHSLTTWWNISRKEGKGLSGHIGRKQYFLLINLQQTAWWKC